MTDPLPIPIPRRAMTTAERGTLLATILGSTVVFLDATVVNVALSAIGQGLPATAISVLEGQTYVVSGYFATLAALLVLAGALSDRYGRRRVFIIGLVGFGATSLLCGLAPTLELLALARILQGATGALLVPGSLAILTSIFPADARPRAFGIWAAATSAATAAGPLVGGLLVETVGWRAVFLINVPFLLVALWSTVRYMPESRSPDTGARFDWLGVVVACLAVGGLVLGLIRGQERGWTDPVALAALGIGVAALVGFPVLMIRRPDPLIPPELFQRRAFAVINLVTLLLYGALYVSISFLYLYLIGVDGYSPLGAALAAIPASVLLAVLSTPVGTAAGRIGGRPFLVAGPLVVATGFLLVARSTVEPGSWDPTFGDPASFIPPGSVVTTVLAGAAVLGIGMGLTVAPLTSTLMASIPESRAGTGSAINNAISRVGQPLLAALAFIIVTSIFYATLGAGFPSIDFADPAIRGAIQPLNAPSPSVPADLAAASVQASRDAFRLVLVLCSVLAAGAAVVSYLGLPRRVRA